MDNVLQQELIDRLQKDVKPGEMHVLDEPEIIAHTKMLYPFRLGRIAWELVPMSKFVTVSQIASPLDKYRAALTFFDDFTNVAALHQDDRLVVLGDQLTSLAISLSVRSLRKVLDAYLELPQATYVFTEGYDWCFNYTFEDDIYFGHCVPRK